MDGDDQPPAWVSALFTEVDRRPADRIGDAQLREMGIDPARARRYFQSHYGMTFQAYHRARRMGLALTSLRQGNGTLDVGLRAGFESPSGFRDAFLKTFGEPPGRGRNTACLVMTLLSSPVGPLVAAANEDGVCFLEFADRRAFQRQMAILRRRFHTAVLPGWNDHLNRLVTELREYFEGRRNSFDVPLIIRGTPFQERVWQRLLAIPYGETVSYERIARDIGAPKAVRAVGRANGANMVALLIPCHRVVGRDGTLTGYGGGLWRKQYLLDLERTPKPPIARVWSEDRRPAGSDE